MNFITLIYKYSLVFFIIFSLLCHNSSPFIAALGTDRHCFSVYFSFHFSHGFIESFRVFFFVFCIFCIQYVDVLIHKFSIYIFFGFCSKIQCLFLSFIKNSLLFWYYFFSSFSLLNFNLNCKEIKLARTCKFAK